MRMRIHPAGVVAVLAGVSSSAWAQSGGGFEITDSTFGSGGGESQGGGFTLSATLGPLEAVPLRGGGFELTGGFLISAGPGDCDEDGDVDLADFLVFQECFTGPGAGSVDRACQCSDFDGDEDVDLGDLITFQALFTGVR